jgi:hypothetical protein
MWGTMRIKLSSILFFLWGQVFGPLRVERQLRGGSRAFAERKRAGVVPGAVCIIKLLI